MTNEEILADYQDLEPEDILAVLDFGARSNGSNQLISTVALRGEFSTRYKPKPFKTVSLLPPITDHRAKAAVLMRIQL